MTSSTKVLLVEDSKVMREVVAISLNGLPIQLLSAESGSEALEMALDDVPLVLLDRSLPDVDGYTLAAELRALYPHLLIVMLTSREFPFDSTLATAAAVADHVQKPFDSYRFFDVVARLLSATGHVQPPQASSYRAADEARPGRSRPPTSAYGEPMASPVSVVPHVVAPAPAAAQFETYPSPQLAPSMPSYELEEDSSDYPLEEGSAYEFEEGIEELAPAPSVDADDILRESEDSANAMSRDIDAQLEEDAAFGAARTERLEQIQSHVLGALPAVTATEAALRAPSEGGGGVPPGDGKLRAVCSVFSPPSPMVGDQFLVQVFAHPAGAEGVVASLAKDTDADAARRGSKQLPLPLQLGTTLRVELEAPQLSVQNPVEHLLWSGTPDSVQFVVMVPWGYAADNALVTVRFLSHLVPLGEIRFKLTIRKGATVDAARLLPQPADALALRFEKVFASYAHEDQREVLRCVQAVRALGHDPFMDVVDLSPGARWERVLDTEIDQCDLFLLFWSQYARRSEWVMKETRRALARQAGDASRPPPIRPIILDTAVQAPDDLQHLHFNDPLALLIQALDDAASRTQSLSSVS